MQGLNFKKISVALCVVLMPVSAFAAGLGKLNVQSAIGEPLRAEIELISASAEELASISAAIAPEDAYTEQGIERPASHSGIKIEVAKSASGSPVLKLKSSQPISDPFLDMLIQLDWNSGRLLREYTVLLDPPGYKGETVPQASSGSARLPSTVTANVNAGAASVPVTNSGAKTSRIKKGIRQAKSHAKPAQNTEVATDSEPAAAAVAGEHLTQKGDTLSKVALEMKPENVSLDQMLVGLYEANKEAFAGNMNRLKVGQILKPPSEEALAAITRKQASQEVKMQTADWNAYRNKLADVVAKTTPNESVVDSQPAGGKIKTAAEDKSTPSATGPKDVVKLSSAAPADGKGDADAKSAQAKITALQEEATAREKSLKEAQGRTSDLEKQVADMKKLIELKNNSMAEMQKQAQQKAAEPAPPAATPTAPTPSAAEPAKAVESAKPAETTKPEVTPAAPVAETPVVKPAVKRVLPPPPAPVEEPGLLSGLLSGDNMPLLAGGGGLLALLGGAWVYLRNKRKKNLADFEQGIMTSGGLKANTVFGNTSSTTSIDTGDTSFLTDFAQSANSGMIDTNDVDPIAEAEVYMAYGRDAQAEEILKDAIVKEPKRYELHLKLLEMYAASKNMSAFEAVSGELYTTLGADSPVWAKVAEIGVKLEPNNPLYQVTTAPIAAAENLAASKLEASDFVDSRIASADDLNFSMNEVKREVVSEPALPEVDTAMDFAGMESSPTETVLDFTGVNQPTIEPTVTMEMPMTSATHDDGLDFDMNLLGDSEEKIEDLPSLNFDTIQPFDHSTETLTDMAMEVKPVFEDTMAGGTLVLGNTVEEEKDMMHGFSFDIPTVAPDSNTVITTSEAEANVLDLSGISLDMGELEEMPSVTEAPEPVEVETKLELVTAYIEMDDKEGAKELLDEVMKEGGANQRKRAEALLKKIS